MLQIWVRVCVVSQSQPELIGLSGALQYAYNAFSDISR